MQLIRKAAELMSPKPESVSTQTELEDVAKLLNRKKITSVPVIDPNGTLVGILTEVGLIKALVSHHAFFGTHETVGDHPEILEKAVFVKAIDPIDQVMKVLLSSPNHRPLVINEKRKLVGIISPKDILKVLVSEVQDSNEANTQLEKVTDKIQNALVIKAHTLEEALIKYSKVLQTATYMMHSVDVNGRVVMMNKKARQALGYSTEDLESLTIEDLYHRKFHNQAKEGIKTILRRGVHQIVKTVMVTHSGALLPVEVKSRAIKSEHEKFLGTLSVVRELSHDDLLPLLSDIISSQDEGPISVD